MFNEIEIERLHLDLDNPRFGLISAGSADEALQLLVKSADLKELWYSINASKFVRFEPLIAIPHPTIIGDFTVIEGNRRLAACKTLLNPDLLNAPFSKRVPKISDEVRSSIQTLPVVIVDERNEASAFIGFKHVNGPATWSSIAKARYGIKMIEDPADHRSPIEKMKELSEKLGDSRGMLLRIFVAYKIYEQAIDLELVEASAFDGPKVQFSHLYTMLNHPPTRDFLGLPVGPLSETSIENQPIKPDFVQNLSELFQWLFGETSVIKSQGKDRPTLQKVIASADGIEALRSTGDLQFAATVAGLNADDWIKNLGECVHRAKKVDNDLIEVLQRLAIEDLNEADRRIGEAILNLRSAQNKIKDVPRP